MTTDLEIAKNKKHLQVEIHPYFTQMKLVDWCKARNITVTGYSPLANPTHMFRKEGQPNLLEEAKLKTLAAKMNKVSHCEVTMKEMSCRFTVASAMHSPLVHSTRFNRHTEVGKRHSPKGEP